MRPGYRRFRSEDKDVDTFVAVDLEMTGLRVKSDRILEIGAVRFEQGHETGRFQTFVNPHRRLDEGIVNLTGITDELVAGAPETKEALLTFLDFAGELPLLGHNLMFDYSFLKQAAVNAGLSFERYGIDTLKIARAMLKEPESKKLPALCDYFNILRERTHRALDDALAAADLYFVLKEKFFAGRPELFAKKPLQYSVKKQGPLTPAQKRDLNHLIIYHRIDTKIDLEHLTKSEASRMIDRIYAQYGRMPGQEG